MAEPTEEKKDRWTVYDKFSSVAKTGDILFRRSDARGAFGLPFMRFVSSATNARYTHAAICYRDRGVLRVVEISDCGCVEYRFLDWYTYCLGNEFAAYRLRDTKDWTEQALMQQIQVMLDEDGDYDFNFNDPKKVYCTEAIAQVYAKAGFELCKPLLMKEIVGRGWYAVIRPLNALFGLLTGGKQKLPTSTALYFVGSENGRGLAGSPLLYKVYEN